MGAVFKARHLKMNRLVALKVIRKELLANPDAIQRFEREVQAAAQLSHPNVVAAYDAAQVGDTHFFAMEYVEGTDLNKLVNDKGPLPVEQACDCIRQAALGLQHAHEQRLVHRDIKPHNLLRTSKGVVKVLDMGLARLRQTSEGVAVTKGLTQEGACMGTPSYMAPEQALDSRKADIRADVYSLGCTLYFLLTGRPPFEGMTAAEVLVKHQLVEVEAAETLRPEVPALVASVLRRMLAKKPEDRFQTPEEVAAALDGWAEASLTQTLPPMASPATTVAMEQNGLLPVLLAKRKDKNRLMVAVPLLIVGIVVGYLVKFDGKTGKPVAAATEAAKPLSEEEEWRQSVAKMKPAEQVKAVEERLKKRNPNFKGKCQPEYGGEGVVGLTVISPEIVDISPVCSTTLRRLSYGSLAGFYSGKLTDLSPLRGMMLSQLDCGDSQVSNLSPVETMPLTSLQLRGSRVTDLRPLQGKKLAFLQIANTAVTDLSPLKGMPLRELQCFETPLSNLEPLRDSPLVILWIQGTNVKDLSPLKGSKLEDLTCFGTPISDLSPLQNVPLKRLICDVTRVSDLTPLQGSPLESLGISGTQVKDLAPLKGLDLVWLDCRNTSISDLKPLQGMRLHTLAITGTDVTDLTPLLTMQVQNLELSFNRERDEPIFAQAEEPANRQSHEPGRLLEGCRGEGKETMKDNPMPYRYAAVLASLVVAVCLWPAGADEIAPSRSRANPSPPTSSVCSRPSTCRAPLPDDTQKALVPVLADRDATKIQQLLDRHVLLAVNINPESRVKVARGPAKAMLQQAGYTPVLVKVVNDGTVTAALNITSPQAGPVYAGTAPAWRGKTARPARRSEHEGRPRSLPARRDVQRSSR